MTKEKDSPEESESWWKQMQDKKYQSNFFYTVWLFLSFVCLGFVVGQRGPAFLDLQLITNTNTKEASAFFTGGSVGYLMGSFLCGLLYDLCNEHFLLMTAVLGLGVSSFVIPLCRDYILMIAMFFLASIFSGALDTGGNVDLLRVWGGDCRSYMQALHFGFALGAVLSPLYTQPFLAPNLDEISNLTETPSHCHAVITTPSPTDAISASSNFSISDLISTTESSNSTAGVTSPEPETLVFYAFAITGVATLLCAVPFAVVFCKHRTFRKTPRGHDQANSRVKFPKFYFLLAVVLLDAFYLLYCAAEDSFGAFLATFTVKQLCWSKTQGSLITAVFYGAFAVSRFLGIFFTHCIQPVRFLVICSIFMVLSFVLLVLSALHNFGAGVWISAIVVGTAMSVIFPTGFLFAEEDLFKVTGKISSSILICSSAGTMIAPPILGYLMDTISNIWFAYLLLIISSLCILSLLTLILYTRLVLVRFKTLQEQPRRQELDISSVPVQETFLSEPAPA